MTRERLSLSFARPLRPLREILRSPPPPHRRQAHAKDAQDRKEGNYLSSKADSVDLWCSSGKACLAHDPGAVISFLCVLCVRSFGHPCLLTASKLTQRTPRPQRRELSFFQSRHLLQPIDDLLDAVLEVNLAEVNPQAQASLAQPELGQNLLAMQLGLGFRQT